MAKLLKLRRGTTSQHSSFTGAEGEVTIDTDKDTAVVHDGSTAAGRALAREDLNNVASASITGRLSSGSIAGAKIANDAIDSQHYAADSIDTEHYAAGSVDSTAIATDAITSTELAANSVTAAHIADGTVVAADIATDAVGSAEIAGDAVNGAHIADDSINSEHIAADSIDAEHYAPNSVDADALAHTSVTAGSYGSATAIPAITVDAQGRITAASTNTVNTTTNLGITRTSTQVTVTSSTGNNAVIGEASGSNSGVMTTAHHDKLDGIAASANNYSFPHTVSASESNNTVCQRNNSGYLHASYFNGSGTFATGGNNSGMQRFTGTNGSDTYGRSYTAAAARTLLNVADGATNVTNTNQLTNGAGFITSADGGNAATVDGIDSSSFLRSDATDSTSHDITFNGGGGAITVGTNSDIRLETGSWTGEASTNDSKLQAHDNHFYMQCRTGTIRFRMGTSDRVIIQEDGHTRPAANNTYDLGTPSYRWRDLYTNDLNLSNEGGANNVDGTWGSYTIQEGEDDLFLLNRRNGKKYKFNLTEVN